MRIFLVYPSPPICREYLLVLEVSGDFPGNNALHELPNGKHCEDAVFIQFVMVFPWFRNRPQEAVEAFLVDSVQLSPVLFC